MNGNSSSVFLINVHHCSDSTAGFSIVLAFTVVRSFVLLPLSFFVLYLGYRRWRKRRSFATTSHCDIFTYNTVALEPIYMLGGTLYFCGEYAGLAELKLVGYYLCCIDPAGQTSFHLLTSAERYLAVVHPVIYLKLRGSRGVRIRNISIVCVWLLCLGWIGVMALYIPEFPYIPMFCFLTVCLVVMSFFSLSVLYVLIRPGPGDIAGDDTPVDQTKLRAFQTITAITGALWMFFLGLLLSLALDNAQELSHNVRCVMLASEQFIGLPSNFVLPLLFLQSAGKLNCCHCTK